MSLEPLPIISCGGIELNGPDESLADVKSILKQTMAKPPRRISRFIQLALIGATRCIGQSSLPQNTNICLASGTGDLEVTFDVLDRVKSQRLAPKPLSFINTVSNATCYYLTQQFALDAASTFVSKQCFALESAFAQARLDAHAFGQASTLIGAVDALTTPMKTHAMRLGVPASAALAEGSHWFRMGARDSSQSAIGWLEDVSYHRNAQAAIKALEHLPGTGRVWSAKGFWLDNDNYTAINTAINGSPYKRKEHPWDFMKRPSARYWWIF